MGIHTVTIDRRLFSGVVQELSAAQEDYLIANLRLAGVLPAAPGDPPQNLDAEAVLTQLLISGRAAQVLAGCLTEVGKTWSIEEAERNARLFAGTKSAADKAAMAHALAGFVACWPSVTKSADPPPATDPGKGSAPAGG